MKRVFFIVWVLATVVAGCSASDVTTSAPAPAAALAVTTTEPAQPVFRIELAVVYEELQLGQLTNEPPIEFALSYDVAAELSPGASRIFPLVTGSVDWVVRCNPGRDDDVDRVATSIPLDVPASLDEIDDGLVEASPDSPWLASPAVSLHDVDGDLWIVHRVPGSLSMGELVVCPGAAEVRASLIPAVGAAAMAQAVNIGGAPLSRAEARNLEAGSFPTTYFTDRIGGSEDQSGWVVAIVRPEDLALGPVPLSFRDVRETDEVEYEFRVTGEIALIP